ncbi:MAG: hypothetical protein H0X07_00135 [Gemmatimonadales bacterium]|nr:hypothetical protein [Gemmatimonadales bacterium]
MGLFDGLSALGQQVGAASLGYGRGALQGEQEGYRRGQAEDLLAAKKAALRQAGEKKKGDSLEAKTAASLLEKYVAAGADPDFRHYMSKNPELFQRFRVAVNRLPHVIRGEALMDDETISLFESLNSPIPKTDAGGSAPFAGGVFGPKPSPASATQPGQPSRFEVQSGDRALKPPEMPNLTAGPPASAGGTNPAMEGVVRRLPGISKTFSGVAAPGGDTVVPSLPGQGAAAPVAPKLDPHSREGIKAKLREIALEEPRPQEDAEPAPAYQKYLNSFSLDQDRRMKRQEALLLTIPKSVTEGARAARAPEIVATNIGLKKDTAALARQRTAESKALLTPKVNNILSTMRKRADDRLLNREKFTEQKRANLQGEDIRWYNAQTQRAAQEGREPYLAAMIEKTKAVIAGSNDANLRARLGAKLKMMMATTSIMDDPTFDDATRDEAAKDVDLIMEQLGAPGKGSTTTTTTTTKTRVKGGGSAVNTRPGRSVAAPPARGAGGSKTVTIGGQTYNFTPAEMVQRMKGRGWSDAQIAQHRSRWKY